MLGILPLLLTESPVKLPAPSPAPAAHTELATQPQPSPIPGEIAPPETTRESLPGTLFPQFSSPKPEFSLPQSAALLETTPLQTTQNQQNWQQCQPSEMKFYQALQLGQIPAIEVAKDGKLVETFAVAQGQTPLQTDQKKTDQLAGKLTQQQQWLEAKLAEIVARDRAAAAQLQETVVTAATEQANQGKFEQARQLIQNSVVPAEAQATVLNQIASLEAETAQATVAKEVGNAKLAADSRRSQQARFAMRPIRQVPQTAIQPINLGPISLSERGLGLSTTPIGQEYLNRSIRPPALLGNGNISLLFPLPAPAPITSGYGWRQHPVLGNQRFHSGVDLGAPEGTPVLAAYSGKVASADLMGGYGLAVVLEHNKGAQDTLYAHLSEVFVRPGEEVTQGMVIGRVGSTGLSTGPHLHFEFRQLTSDGWITQDPEPQIKYALNQLVNSLQTAQTGSPSPKAGG